MSIKIVGYAVALSGLLAVSGVAQAQNSREDMQNRQVETRDHQTSQTNRMERQRHERMVSAQRAAETRRHTNRHPTDERSMAYHGGGDPSSDQHHDSHEMNR